MLYFILTFNKKVRGSVFLNKQSAKKVYLVFPFMFISVSSSTSL